MQIEEIGSFDEKSVDADAALVLRCYYWAAFLPPDFSFFCPTYGTPLSVG